MMAKFTDIFEDVTKQGTKIPTNLYLETGMYPIIDQGQSQVVGYTNETEGLFTDIPAIIFGDHTRIIKYVDTPCFLGADGVKLLKAKDPTANYKYLYYALCCADIPNTGYNRHFKWLKEVDIPEYSAEEQSGIVMQLEKIDALISLRKQQLSKLDELVKSRFIELFGSQCHNEKNYPYGKIDDVAEIYLGLTHTPEYIETGVKFISAKNTSCDYLDLSDVKYISKEEYASAPAGAKPRKGDVLFSRVGSNLGHPVILDIDEELCTFVSLGYLRTKGRVTNLYLKHWMRDDFFAEQVRQKVVGGGQPNLNTGWLKEFRIIIPPMDIQEQFAAFVEQTDKSKLAIQQSLEKFETLKKALMQKYFG